METSPNASTSAALARLSTLVTPAARTEHVRNIALDLVLTILTLGIFNLWVQHRQMRALNYFLQSEKYSFWMWFALCFVTCGLYHFYHEYRKSADLAELQGQSGSLEPIAGLLLTAVGLMWVADALQQAQINRILGQHAL